MEVHVGAAPRRSQVKAVAVHLKPLEFGDALHIDDEVGLPSPGLELIDDVCTAGERTYRALLGK